MNKRLLRFKAKTDPKVGCPPLERKIDDYINNGVVCIDKVKGPTTHQVAQKVKEILKSKKVGHAGQLEPPMGGLVVVLLENACKLTSYLSEADREYSLKIHFNRPVDREQLEQALAKFTGKIKQVPPLRSKVRRVLRTRNVDEIKILEWKDKEAKIFIRCQAGTYLRKLFYDMGRLLRATVNLSSMRRLGIGNLKVEQAVSFEDLKAAQMAWEKGDEKLIRSALYPVDLGVQGKSIVMVDESIHKLCCGAPIFLQDVCQIDPDIEVEEHILVKSLKDEVICVAQAFKSSEEMKNGTEGFVANPTRIVMDPGTYK